MLFRGLLYSRRKAILSFTLTRLSAAPVIFRYSVLFQVEWWKAIPHCWLSNANSSFEIPFLHKLTSCWYFGIPFRRLRWHWSLNFCLIVSLLFLKNVFNIKVFWNISRFKIVYFNRCQACTSLKPVYWLTFRTPLFCKNKTIKMKITNLKKLMYERTCKIVSVRQIEIWNFNVFILSIYVASKLRVEVFKTETACVIITSLIFLLCLSPRHRKQTIRCLNNGLKMLWTMHSTETNASPWTLVHVYHNHFK